MVADVRDGDGGGGEGQLVLVVKVLGSLLLLELGGDGSRW